MYNWPRVWTWGRNLKRTQQTLVPGPESNSQPCGCEVAGLTTAPPSSLQQDQRGVLSLSPASSGSPRHWPSWRRCTWGEAGRCGRRQQWCSGWRRRWRRCCGVSIPRTLWWRTRKTSEKSPSSPAITHIHTRVQGLVLYSWSDSTRRKQRYQSAPRNIHRHVLLSEIKEAVSTLPLVRNEQLEHKCHFLRLMVGFASSGTDWIKPEW